MRTLIVLLIMASLILSCNTEQKAQLQTAQSIIELSDNLKPNHYNPTWQAAQKQWKETLQNTTDEKVVAKHLMELSQHVNQDKISPKWDAMKFVWEEELAKAKTKNQVRYLIIEFEEYTRPSMIKSWKEDRVLWYKTINELR